MRIHPRRGRIVLDGLILVAEVAVYPSCDVLRELVETEQDAIRGQAKRSTE